MIDNFDYETYIKSKIMPILYDINEVRDDDLKVEIANELAFAKIKTFDPNTIYIIIKRLNTTQTYETITMPIQLITICQQNILGDTQTLLDTFVAQNNYLVYTQGDISVKQEYSKSVVLNNFNEVGYGYRSVLFVSGTLYLVSDIYNVDTLTITADSKTTVVRPINFTWAYTMSPNTQQELTENLSSSVKSVSVVNIGFVIPAKQNEAIDTIIEIMKGNTTGNLTFTLTFDIASGKTITYDMKLTASNFTNTPTTIAGLQLGFVR